MYFYKLNIEYNLYNYKMSKIILSSTVSDLFFTKPYYERNITDIKEIYLNQLTRILTPCMFDSIKLIYNKSCQVANGDMSIEYAFKVCLKDLVNLSSTSIIKEVAKIKQLSNSASYFDNLIKSVIKSHIVLLSYNVSKDSCPLYNLNSINIDTNQFIHKCYIELGNIIFNDPRLFILCLKDGDGLNNVDGVIRAGNRFDKMVKRCISKVIFDYMPVNDVLVEYLNKEKITDEHIKAKQDLEKDEFINQVINGLSNNINNLFNERKDIIVSEVLTKLQSLLKNSELFNQNNNSNNINIENPIDINNNQNSIINSTETTKQINNVINNDIPNDNNKQQTKDNLLSNNDNNNDNDKLLSDESESSILSESESSNDDKDSDDEDDEDDEDNEDNNDSEEIILDSKKINNAGEKEQTNDNNEMNNEIKEIIDNEKNEKNEIKENKLDENKLNEDKLKENKKEREHLISILSDDNEEKTISDNEEKIRGGDQEITETTVKRRGRPKKFTKTDGNKISLNKFK